MTGTGPEEQEPVGMARRGTVTGPVEGTRPPFGAPKRDVSVDGYVVEEWFLEGTTTAYGLREGDTQTPDGRWDAGPVGEAPYRTRLLVVRPEDPARANGKVLLTWNNVSAGFEGPAPEHGELYRAGWTWVGVSAQEVGLYGYPGGVMSPMGRGAVPVPAGLVDHDPRRYGSLRHPGDEGSFEIYRQAAHAVAADRPRHPDPLGGIEVRHVVADGGSQSAMRLVAYANAVHHLDPVLDAYLLTVWEGRAPHLGEGSLPTGGVRTMIRTDLGVPVLVVNSEFEATSMLQLPIPQRDHDLLRLWEVAGTPHGNARSRLTQVDGRGRTPNVLTYRPVREAALRHMARWLEEGAVPPSVAHLAVDPTTGDLARDDDGLAIGGVRLPELEAPTGEHRGLWIACGRAPLFGGSKPFSKDLIRLRYGSRSELVRQRLAALDALVAAGLVLAEDEPAQRERLTAEAPDVW